jgi:Druantia protein DruA/DDE_Tnp_1-associated/Transposase DDE domain
VAAETIDLRSVYVRPLAADERTAFDRLLIEHHYLHSARMVGESLRYVATDGHRWLALLGWGTAAFKCGPRDRWIGWPPTLQWRRLRLIANNARFLVLDVGRQPHLASRVLALNCRRLAADWKAAFGHAVVLAETFVERDRFAGTCYRAAGWTAVGETRGFGRSAGTYYEHGITKRVFVRPLHRRARSLLTDPCALPTSIVEEEGMDSLSLRLAGPGGLHEALGALVDPRKARGLRYRKISGLITLASAAVLAGRRSYAAIAQWVADVPQELLKELGCIRGKDGRYTAPSEPTIRRAISGIDGEKTDRIVGEWLTKQGISTKGNVIAIDGKTLRGSHGANRQGQAHLVAALTHREGAVIAQTKTDAKSNEIPAVQELLSSMPLEGALVTMDAMHTQKKTAEVVVEKKVTI